MNGQKQVDATNEHLSNKTNVVVAIANLTKIQSEWVEMEYGDADNGNFVIHFTDHHQQRTFPKSPKLRQLIVNVITQELDSLIPKEVHKNFLDTPEGWDKVLYTIKLINYNSKSLSFREDKLVECLTKIGKEVSKIIESSHVRRKF